MSILKEMTGSLNVAAPSQVIPERAAAIDYAVSIAQPGDVLVVLGKGHESGQEINGVVTPFSDQQVLRDAIEAGR